MIEMDVSYPIFFSMMKVEPADGSYIEVMNMM